MGLFDGLSKALNEAMANDDSYGKAVNPGFREGYDGPAQKTRDRAECLAEALLLVPARKCTSRTLR